MVKEGGVDVQMNASADEIFNDDVANIMSTFLSQKVSWDSLARYASIESVKKHEEAKASGVRSVRHCPIAIHLGALI